MLWPTVVDVKPLSGYRLELLFDNREWRIFDVSRYIHGNWYGLLADEGVFRTVRVNGDSVEWGGGQDLAAHELWELGTPFEGREVSDAEFERLLRRVERLRALEEEQAWTQP